MVGGVEYSSQKFLQRKHIYYVACKFAHMNRYIVGLTFTTLHTYYESWNRFHFLCKVLDLKKGTYVGNNTMDV